MICWLGILLLFGGWLRISDGSFLRVGEITRHLDQLIVISGVWRGHSIYCETFELISTRLNLSHLSEQRWRNVVLSMFIVLTTCRLTHFILLVMRNRLKVFSDVTNGFCSAAEPEVF